VIEDDTDNSQGELPLLSLLRVAFSNFRFQSLFIRILFLLVLLVVLPALVVGSVGNWYSQSIIQKEVNQSSLQMLEQTRRLMDELLNEIDKKAIQLVKYDTILELMEDPKPDNKTEKINRVQDYLLNFYASSPYISSVYVYYKKAGMIQTPFSDLHPIEDFDDKAWLPYLKEQMRKEGKWMIGGVHPGEASQGPEMTQVTLMRPVPIYGDEVRGAVVVNLNQQAFFQSPSFRLMREAEEMWMISPDGLHAYNNKTGQEVESGRFAVIQEQLGEDMQTFSVEFDGTPYSIALVSSPYTGWKYVDIIPTEVLLYRGWQVEKFIYLLAAFSIGVAVVCALLMTKMIYKPIYSLFEFVRTRRGKDGDANRPAQGKSEMAFLHAALQSMSTQGEELELKLRETLPVLRLSFLNSVLHEKTQQVSEREAKFAHYQLPVTDFGFFVCILRIDDYENFTSKYAAADQSLIRYFIAKVADEVAGSYCRIMHVNTETRDVIFICNLRTEDTVLKFRSEAIQLMTEICTYIRQYLQITVSIGLGDLKPDCGLISDSYQEALKALDVWAFKGQEVLAADWLTNREESSQHALMHQLGEVKRELLTGLRESDNAAVDACLDQFNRFVKSLDGYPYGLIQHAYVQLTAAIHKRAVELGMGQEYSGMLAHLYEQVMRRETADQLMRGLSAYIAQVRKGLAGLLEKPKGHVGEQIMAYIRANFDKEISLGGIADQLQLDISYVSRLFKQETNLNFMEHVISLRLERARKLLTETGLSIKEIGIAVGYANPRSFNRIFKQYEGLTPGEYRGLHAPKRLKQDEIY